MAQRILEPGQIETLAQRSIPRIRLPQSASLFARRAARLRHLAATSAIGAYLELLAELVEAQDDALPSVLAQTALPRDAELARAHEHRMPPLHPATWIRGGAWRSTLKCMLSGLAADGSLPDAVTETIARIQDATPEWIDQQAGAVLGQELVDAPLDLSTAPFIMTALQVHWIAASSQLVAENVHALDVPGICPLCGSFPVASIVRADAQFQGYRYLHCALCATEWHLVRVQCTQCGASGKDISYHTVAGPDASNGSAESAVRAETCEQCRGYRKILYQEKDPEVEPVADDLAAVTLDLLLGERGYHRTSHNPLLWTGNET
jgi:FdhE protein